MENVITIDEKSDLGFFDRNTELLTNHGWKSMYTLKEYDELFSYNIESGLIEQVPIDYISIIHYKGKLLFGKNKHIQYAVTNQQNLIVRHYYHKYQRKTDRELTPKEKQYFDSLKNDNDKFHLELAQEVFQKRRIFKTAGVSANKNTYDINLLRLCMAVIADGYLCKKTTATVSYGFNLKKERDKGELEGILGNLKWHYTKRYSTQHERFCGRKDIYTYFINSTCGSEIIEIIGIRKKIPMWFLSLDPSILRQLIITYAKFDGSIDMRGNNSGITIFSKDEDNIDMLQAMSVLCGMRCIKKTLKNYTVTIDGTTTFTKCFYNLYITQLTDESRLSEDLHSRFFYNAEVWNVKNRNSTVITRRKGKVCFQGCH